MDNNTKEILLKLIERNEKISNRLIYDELYNSLRKETEKFHNTILSIIKGENTSYSQSLCWEYDEEEKKRLQDIIDKEKTNGHK